MAKNFNNVSEMIKKISSTKAFKDDALAELANKNIAKFLFHLRCKCNLTQRELAKKIGCTQSKISKIENSRDNELAINDLLDYGKTFNLQLEVKFRNQSAKIDRNVKENLKEE